MHLSWDYLYLLDLMLIYKFNIVTINPRWLPTNDNLDFCIWDYLRMSDKITLV